MAEVITQIEEYECLQKELKSKIRYFRLSSPEVVGISQKIDKYIVQAMKGKEEKTTKK